MRGKYSFWIKVLSCLVAVLAVTSFLIPDAGRGEVWLFGDSHWLSGICGVLFIIATAFSLMAINTKSVNNVFNPSITSIFFLLIVLLNPSAVYFSPVHPAVLLFVWGQYSFITDRKFLSMFLLSLSALLWPPLLCVLPLVLVISIFGAADIPRVTVKSLGGMVIPFLYLLCYRFMVTNDVKYFIDRYLHSATQFSPSFTSVGIPSLFMVACIAWISLHAVSYMFARLYNNSIITEHILKMEFMCLLLGSAVFVLFRGDGSEPVNMVVALPVAMILSHYFTANINTAAARIELILLCCAVSVSRLSYFI